MDISIVFATQRAHEGAERFRPERHGSRFSSNCLENLRFGRLTFSADSAQMQALHQQVMQVDCSALAGTTRVRHCAAAV